MLLPNQTTIYVHVTIFQRQCNVTFDINLAAQGRTVEKSFEDLSRGCALAQMPITLFDHNWSPENPVSGIRNRPLRNYIKISQQS